MDKIEPSIVNTAEKKLVGQRLILTLANYPIKDLWKSFHPKVKELKTINNELISISVYDSSYFNAFDPFKEFEKWAAVEVSDFENLPIETEIINLPGGLYAVFDYRGSSENNSIFQYIYGEWVPNSIFELDDRPHFEVLGDNYSNQNKESEEKIWIPIRPKSLN